MTDKEKELLAICEQAAKGEYGDYMPNDGHLYWHRRPTDLERQLAIAYLELKRRIETGERALQEAPKDSNWILKAAETITGNATEPQSKSQYKRMTAQGWTSEREKALIEAARSTIRAYDPRHSLLKQALAAYEKDTD